MTQDRVKILVDNSVRHHAVEHKGVWGDHGAVMWGGEAGIPVKTGRMLSKAAPIHIAPERGGAQGGYIASLAIAHLNGAWEAYTSDALLFERLHHPSGKYVGNFGGFSWFNKINFKNNSTLEGFTASIPSEIEPIDALKQFLSSCANSEYQKIRSGLESCGAKKSSQDAWHIFCVDLLGLDKFLTCDAKLIGQIRSMRDKGLRQRILDIVVLPVQACEAMGLDAATQEEREYLRQTLGPF